MLEDQHPVYHKIFCEKGQQRFHGDPGVSGFIQHLEDKSLGVGQEGLPFLHDRVLFFVLPLAGLDIFCIKHLHVPAPPFGFVQGRVRESEEFFITAAEFRRHGDADAAADVEFFAVTVGKAAAQHVPEFFAALHYTAAVRRVPDQHYEFVAAYPA